MMPALKLALSTHSNVGWYDDVCSNNDKVNNDDKTKKHDIEVEVTSQEKLQARGNCCVSDPLDDVVNDKMTMKDDIKGSCDSNETFKQASQET